MLKLVLVRVPALGVLGIHLPVRIPVLFLTMKIAIVKTRRGAILKEEHGIIQIVHVVVRQDPL